MFRCSVCSFQSMYKYNVDRHEKVKHSKPNFTPHTINNNVTHQTGSGAEQTASFLARGPFKPAGGKRRSITWKYWAISKAATGGKSYHK